MKWLILFGMSDEKALTVKGFISRRLADHIAFPRLFRRTAEETFYSRIFLEVLFTLETSTCGQGILRFAVPGGIWNCERLVHVR